MWNAVGLGGRWRDWDFTTERLRVRSPCCKHVAPSTSKLVVYLSSSS